MLAVSPKSFKGSTAHSFPSHHYHQGQGLRTPSFSSFSLPSPPAASFASKIKPTMDCLTKHTYRHKQLTTPFHHHHPPSASSRPISLLTFRTLPPPPLKSSSSSFSIKASSSSQSSLPHSVSSNSRNPNPDLFKTLESFPFSLLKTTLIAAVAASALFFSRFNVKPLIAAPPAVDSSTATNEQVSEEEREKPLEEYLQSNSQDVQALRNLMEIKIKSQKVQEAISIIDRLIEVEPDELEWPLLKSHMYCYNGELELAKMGFNEILQKDPLRVEGYHGLVMAASQADSTDELKAIEKRIEVAMNKCEKEKNKGDLRDFKLLLAQIRVIEGDYNDALRIYQGLVREEPRDFRPYLCQGIIFTLLRKKDEADKNFEKYRRLVPQGHPYAQYFDDNMMATKLFSQKVEMEQAKAGSGS